MTFFSCPKSSLNPLLLRNLIARKRVSLKDIDQQVEDNLQKLTSFVAMLIN